MSMFVLMKNCSFSPSELSDIALQSGDDVKTVQENMGHFSAAFTLDVYGHVTEKMKLESANRMEQFIRSVST